MEGNTHLLHSPKNTLQPMSFIGFKHAKVTKKSLQFDSGNKASGNLGFPARTMLDCSTLSLFKKYFFCKILCKGALKMKCSLYTRLVVPEHFHVTLEVHEHEKVLQAANGAVVDAGGHARKVLPEIAQSERRRH